MLVELATRMYTCISHTTDQIIQFNNGDNMFTIVLLLPARHHARSADNKQKPIVRNIGNL
jgi:hypothetical protein